MDSIKNYVKENRHLYIVLYYLIILFLYNTFNKNVIPEHYMYCELDNYIPFIKQMVIPYVIWYGYITIPLIYFAFFSPDDFVDLCVFLFVGMTICFIIFAIYPNGQNLRPNIEVTDIYTYIINRIYTADNPTNSLPSMHVLNSIAVHSTIINSKKLKNNWVHPVSSVLMILISISTVMIKQHSILDVCAAVVLSFVIYKLIYKYNMTKKIKERTIYNSESVRA